MYFGEEGRHDHYDAARSPLIDPHTPGTRALAQYASSRQSLYITQNGQRLVIGWSE